MNSDCVGPLFMTYELDALLAVKRHKPYVTEVETHCRINDINKTCLAEFRRHWACLEQNNQQLWQCRRPERQLNACVFEKLVSETLSMLQCYLS